MGKRPNLSSIETLFDKGKDFKLTDAQYEKKAGCALPKNKYYLKNKSALSRMAESKGFKVEVIEKTVKFTKEKEK